MTAPMSKRNNKVLAGLVVVVAAMIGLSYASVPLYDLFCRVTGFGGTTQVADGQSAVVTDRRMKVRFDSSVNARLDWAFQPVRRQVELKVGENRVAYFRATNRSDEALVGTATFNVTPLKAGPYFNKIECFCFTEQRLEPGQSVEMPVAFFIDPAISEDVNLDEVKTITLSYTFFPVEGKATRQPARVSRLDSAGPLESKKLKVE